MSFSSYIANYKLSCERQDSNVISSMGIYILNKKDHPRRCLFHYALEIINYLVGART